MWHLTEFYILRPWGKLGIVIVIMSIVVVVVVVVNNYNHCNYYHYCCYYYYYYYYYLCCNCQYLIQENNPSMHSFNVAIIDYSVIYN